MADRKSRHSSNDLVENQDDRAKKMRTFMLFLIALAIAGCVVMLGRIEITLQEYRPIKMYNQQFDIGMHKGSYVEIHEEKKP